MIRDFFLLSSLHLRTAKNQAWGFLRHHPIQAFVISAGLLFFYGGFLRIAYVALARIYHQETVGIIMCTKLIQLMLLVSVGVATMSSLTTAISNLYMSKDLEFQFSLPVKFPSWIYYRQSQVILQSCWMVLVFGGPIVYFFLKLSGLSLGLRAVGLIAFLMLVSMMVFLATMLSFILIRLFPARRVHQVLFIISIILMSLLVFYFRYIEPEKFIGPGGMEEFNGYLDLVNPTAQAWNPAKWTGDFLTALSLKNWPEARLHGFRIGFIFVMFQIPFLFSAYRFYRSSWDRALHALSGETPEPGKMGFLARYWSNRLDNRNGNQTAREVLLFMRDPSQWTQIFILAGLLALYLYSITKLPLSPFGGTRYQLALGNTVFVAFVGLSICSRFIFTSFSTEGQALWLMKVAPESWEKWIESKLKVYGIPTLFFCLILSLGSGIILELQPRMLLRVGMATAWDLMLIVGASVVFGLLFMDPKIENANKMIVSPGGLLLMSVCMFFMLAHGILRIVGSSEMLMYYFRRAGWPNLEGWRYTAWAGTLGAIEIAILGLFLWRAIRHLRSAEDIY
ncbi:MAG: hypothetical protein KDC71_12005 [Acidobacteria bacterium]|nr:hypothetical protein [Acidobacteriota bacterium]